MLNIKEINLSYQRGEQKNFIESGNGKKQNSSLLCSQYSKLKKRSFLLTLRKPKKSSLLDISLAEF